MPALIASALAFFASLSGIIVGLGVIVAFVIAAIADPSGWINQSLCYAIDMIVSVFPSTPNNLRLESIILSISSYIPSAGVFLIREAYLAFRDVFSLIVVFKVYKMIPFKAT